MSLIPSESSSFSDLLGRGLGASPNSKWRVPNVPDVEPPPPPRKKAPASDLPKNPPPVAKEQPKKKEQPPPKAENKALKQPPAAPAPRPVIPAVTPKPVAEKPAPAVPPKPVPQVPVAPKQQPAARSILPPVKLERRVLSKPLPPREVAIHPSARPKTPAKAFPGLGQDETDSPRPAAPAALRAPKARLRPQPVFHPREFGQPLASELSEQEQELDEARAPRMSFVPPPPTEEQVAETCFAGAEPEPERDEEDHAPRRLLLQWRPSGKIVRFLIIEAITIFLLIGSAMLAVSARHSADAVGLITRILTISLAVVAALVPIIFFGLPDSMPRDRR